MEKVWKQVTVDSLGLDSTRPSSTLSGWTPCGTRLGSRAWSATQQRQQAAPIPHGRVRQGFQLRLWTWSSGCPPNSGLCWNSTVNQCVATW